MGIYDNTKPRNSVTSALQRRVTSRIPDNPWSLDRFADGTQGLGRPKPQPMPAKKPTPKPMSQQPSWTIDNNPWSPEEFANGTQGLGNGSVNKPPTGPVSHNPTTPAGNPNQHPPMPQMPSIEDFIGGDTTFQSQKSLFQKALEDYMLSQGIQRGRINQDFDRTMGRLGLQRGRDLEGMEDDFAGRNMIHSGLYGENVGEYNTDFQNVVNDLNLDKSRSLEDLVNQLRMFQSELAAQEENARLEAIRRRAEQYSVLPDGSTSGPTTAPPISPAEPSPPTNSGGRPSSPSPNKPNPAGPANPNMPAKHELNMENFPRISALLKKFNGDKSDVVAALVGKGNAGKLGPNQLKAIGFSNPFIKNRLGG